jgi:restriction system protein
MAIPPLKDFYRPVLEVLADGQPHKIVEIVTATAAALGLSDTDMEVRQANGRPTYEGRVLWTITYFFQAGLFARPQRATYELTESGKATLRSDEVLDNRFFKKFPAFVEFTQRRRAAPAAATLTSDADDSQIEDLDPETLAAQAVQTNRAVLVGDLLDRVVNVTPSAFEQLVINLIDAMGYADAGGQTYRTGRSGDNGIDGVITRDPLGLDKVYVQAKRYERGTSIAEADIRDFVGALTGKQVTSGVFFTTSKFSEPARKFAERVSTNVILIDGQRLAELLIDHGVGVQATSTLVINRLDDDYFDNLV